MEPLRKALSLNPRHGRAHLHMGMIQLERQEVSAAVLSFQSAARYDPAGPAGQAAAKLLALIESAQRKEQDAREQARQQQLRQQEQHREQELRRQHRNRPIRVPR